MTLDEEASNLARCTVFSIREWKAALELLVKDEDDGGAGINLEDAVAVMRAGPSIAGLVGPYTLAEAITETLRRWP